MTKRLSILEAARIVAEAGGTITRMDTGGITVALPADTIDDRVLAAALRLEASSLDTIDGATLGADPNDRILYY